MAHSTRRHPGNAMSAFPPKADIVQRGGNVRFVPKAAVSKCSKNPLSKASLFDQFIGGYEQVLGHCEVERLGGFKIYH
jgi:hypothetical protein